MHEAGVAGKIPKPALKFVAALLMAPVAWILSASFLDAFAISLKHGLLASRSFGSFAGGLVLFVILYPVLPRKPLMIAYVFGHEVTHALWAKLFGGRVDNRFHVGTEGGHVLTDRVNTWIVLAPYFFPIYSVLAITLFGTAALVADLSSLRWVLFLLLGFTLAFHLTFTCLMITKGQPDLHYGGTFFSLMVIYGVNLMVVTALLLAASGAVTPGAYGALVAHNASATLGVLCKTLSSIVTWAGEIRQGMGKS